VCVCVCVCVCVYTYIRALRRNRAFPLYRDKLLDTIQPSVPIIRFDNNNDLRRDGKESCNDAYDERKLRYSKGIRQQAKRAEEDPRKNVARNCAAEMLNRSFC